MTVHVLPPDTTRDLARRIKKLADGDVLVIGHWRITVASDPERSYWLEGRGLVRKVPRAAKSGAKLATLMREFDSIRYANAERSQGARS
ncbi:MAG: hypothetical protein LC098_10600 [Burkholderiales bacterium]|nr:hypothetical protein [Burkholderiales bacterium]